MASGTAAVLPRPLPPSEAPSVPISSTRGAILAAEWLAESWCSCCMSMRVPLSALSVWGPVKRTRGLPLRRRSRATRISDAVRMFPRTGSAATVLSLPPGFGKQGPKTPTKDRDELNEARVLSKLNHPHIVRFFDCWVEDDPAAVAHVLGMSCGAQEGAEDGGPIGFVSVP